MSLPRWISLRQQPSLPRRRARLPAALPSILPLAVAVLLALCIAASPFAEVHAKDCITRASSSMIAWKFNEGTFMCDNCIGVDMLTSKNVAFHRRWTEYDSHHHAVNSFVEEHRDDNQIVLHDESRGISILLRHQVSGIRTEGEKDFNQLHSGGFISVVDCI
ncbi:hypothetical protein LSCM1_04735 [Leishmania martiniquensis]|uniref:Uncharacterized protein n=1 Tax=Leishmania martiniquensis TaxID=1580590 RepID=A0A836HK79_9TRYP|nr:hypothetical protein LSCM1_04735 [Leishmania martiniquensis]